MYMFFSVYAGASRFPLLEIQPMDSYCSNSVPVTEEVGEECFLLKINPQESQLSRPFLPFIAGLKGSASHRPFPSRRWQLRDAALLPTELARSLLPVPGAVPSPAIPLAFSGP